MTRALHAVAALAAALVVAACASTPVTLIALPPAPPVDADTGADVSVMLREVSVPGYLEGFPVVLGRDGDTLVVSRNAEWAERLSLGATRVLRDALAQRLGTSRVAVAGDGGISDVELVVEFLALDPQGGALQLDARWFYACSRGGRGGRGGRTRLQVPMASATPGRVAAATGEALARFGAILAAELSCPPQQMKSRPDADLSVTTPAAPAARLQGK